MKAKKQSALSRLMKIAGKHKFFLCILRPGSNQCMGCADSVL